METSCLHSGPTPILLTDAPVPCVFVVPIVFQFCLTIPRCHRCSSSAFCFKAIVAYIIIPIVTLLSVPWRVFKSATYWQQKRQKENTSSMNQVVLPCALDPPPQHDTFLLACMTRPSPITLGQRTQRHAWGERRRRSRYRRRKYTLACQP